MNLYKKPTILIAFSLVTAGVLFAQTEADFTVTLNSTGDGVVITGYTGKAVQVRIPALIQGKPVRTIGASAFSWCTSLVTVSIPEGVTTIGDSAFQDCTKLSAVTLPQSLTSLGRAAFADCHSLASVTFKTTGLTVISGGAFNNCFALKTIIIPEGVETIGRGAFSNCTRLTSLVLPSTIKKIEAGAFRDLNDSALLTTVTIPDSVETIEFLYEGNWGYDEPPFGGCGKLTLASQAALKKRGYTGSF